MLARLDIYSAGVPNACGLVLNGVDGTRVARRELGFYLPDVGRKLACLQAVRLAMAAVRGEDRAASTMIYSPEPLVLAMLCGRKKPPDDYWFRVLAAVRSSMGYFPDLSIAGTPAVPAHAELALKIAQVAARTKANTDSGTKWI